MNILQDTTRLALMMCEKYIDEESDAVDCTCGRGNDTLFLARKCRRVYSFDIQEEALVSAQQLMSANGISWRVWNHKQQSAQSGSEEKVIFVKDNHAYLERYINVQPALVIFNLGYLPGGDKRITTVAENTVKAVKTAVDVIKVGGLVCVTIYPGHEEGRKEFEAIKSFAQDLEKNKFHCVMTDMLNQSSAAPQILWITKKK